MQRLASTFLALLALGATSPVARNHVNAEAPRAALSPDFASLAHAALPAVVGIVATQQHGASASGDPMREFLDRMYGEGDQKAPVRGLGTGFFIQSDGFILTNGHVVEGASDIMVSVGTEETGERNYPATVVGRDEPTDIALLKIEGGTSFPVVALGDSDTLSVGQWVLAIGNPFGLSHSVTVGIVSYKGRRDVNPSGRPGYYDFIQTDASINPGNSGGPLLNTRGEVIGINSAINASGQGIGFAIPINMARQIADELRRHGRVARGRIGISVQDLTPDLADSFALPDGHGAVITEVEPDGPGERAGLRVGDVVRAFDHAPIDHTYKLRWLAATAGGGHTVTALVRRGRQDLKVTVTLDEAPEPTAIAVAHPPDLGPLGVRVELVDGARPATTAKGGQVRVSAIDPRAAAYASGLRVGDLVRDVDGTTIATPGEFVRAMNDVDEGAVVRLFVQRGDKPTFIAFRK